MSIKEYLNKIKPYLSDMTNYFKTQGEWKIELTMTIDFMSFEDSKDSNETSLHIKRNNIETMVGNETNEIIEELFDSLLQRHQEGLEESMRRSNLFYDGVDLLYNKLHKISLNRGGSYIDSPKWLKKKGNNKSKNNVFNMV